MRRALISLGVSAGVLVALIIALPFIQARRLSKQLLRDVDALRAREIPRRFLKTDAVAFTFVEKSQMLPRMFRRVLFVLMLSLGGCQCLEPVNEDLDGGATDAGSDAGSSFDAGADAGALLCASSPCVSTGTISHCNGTDGFSCIQDECFTECPDEGAGRVCEVNQGTYCLECGDAGTHCPMTGTTQCGFPQTTGTATVEAGTCDLTDVSLMRTASAQCRYFTSLADGGTLGELWKLEGSQYVAYFPQLGGWCTGRPAYTGAPRVIINCPSCRFVMMGFE